MVNLSQMNKSIFSFAAGLTVRGQVIPSLEEYFSENNIRNFSLEEKKGRFETFYTLSAKLNDAQHNDLLYFLESLNIRNLEVMS